MSWATAVVSGTSVTILLMVSTSFSAMASGSILCDSVVSRELGRCSMRSFLIYLLYFQLYTARVGQHRHSSLV
jgi:hypothetical protein